jgi:hypothetical protein
MSCSACIQRRSSASKCQAATLAVPPATLRTALVTYRCLPPACPEQRRASWSPGATPPATGQRSRAAAGRTDRPVSSSWNAGEERAAAEDARAPGAKRRLFQVGSSSTNRVRLVLFGMQNRTLGSLLGSD